MNTSPGQQNTFFFPYRQSLTDGSMETENIESINVKEILQGQGINNTQQGFYQPMTGIYMQNGIPMNVTIPYNYMQGFPQVQGNPNTFNQQQIISSNDIQKSTMSLVKLRNDSINKRDEQIAQLGKEESDLITSANTNEKEELKKEDENLDKSIEKLTKGATELFKIYAEHIDKEESEIKDSEKKESNSDEKKKPKKESLQGALEKSQKVLLKGITKLTKQSNKRKTEISAKKTETVKEITIRYSGKRSEVITNQQNDIISVLPQIMLSETAQMKETMLQQFENAGQRFTRMEGTINTLSKSANELANFTNNQYTNLQKEKDQLSNQNTELRNINQQLNINSTQLRMENQQLGNTINSQNTELTNLQQQNSEQQQRIKELEDKNNELRDAIYENRGIIESIRNRRATPDNIQTIYITELTNITVRIGKEFIKYLSDNYPNVEKVNGIDFDNLVKYFYEQNIYKYLSITIYGKETSIIEIGKQYNFNEENIKTFITNHLIDTFLFYMYMLSVTTLNKDPGNQKADEIRKQSNNSVHNEGTSKNIVDEIRETIKELFSTMPAQQGYAQQQMPNTPFGGFNNYNPFMSQPQYQGYPQQQYVPQQNTSQFVNQSQTQYQQQTSNQPQNQQPEINIQQTAMPTGSTANLNNISKTSETNSNGAYTVETKRYQFDKKSMNKMLEEAQTILKNEGRTRFKLKDIIDRAFEINNINDEILKQNVYEIYSKPPQKK